MKLHRQCLLATWLAPEASEAGNLYTVIPAPHRTGSILREQKTQNASNASYSDSSPHLLWLLVSISGYSQDFLSEFRDSIIWLLCPNCRISFSLFPFSACLHGHNFFMLLSRFETLNLYILWGSSCGQTFVHAPLSRSSEPQKTRHSSSGQKITGNLERSWPRLSE